MLPALKQRHCPPVALSGGQPAAEPPARVGVCVCDFVRAHASISQGNNYNKSVIYSIEAWYMQNTSLSNKNNTAALALKLMHNSILRRVFER
eukprot:1138790-Pelagomonas_calceolata.AAC.7